MMMEFRYCTMIVFSCSWGRGHPDEYTEAIAIGEEKFDDSDKKPRAGQILWIRGLTRLQTQVSKHFPDHLINNQLWTFLLSVG